jgi:hypothetical protein
MAQKSSKTYKKPEFKSELEEADWYHSPAGKRYTSQKLADAMRKGIMISEARTPEERKAAMNQARSEGRAVRFKYGLEVKRTDPAVLENLMKRVKAKQTQSVSLRIPLADLEKAKKLAEKTGIGYQTLLKEIIHEGLQRAS